MASMEAAKVSGEFNTRTLRDVEILANDCVVTPKRGEASINGMHEVANRWNRQPR